MWFGYRVTIYGVLVVHVFTDWLLDDKELLLLLCMCYIVLCCYCIQIPYPLPSNMHNFQVVLWTMFCHTHYSVSHTYVKWLLHDHNYMVCQFMWLLDDKDLVTASTILFPQSQTCVMQGSNNISQQIHHLLSAAAAVGRHTGVRRAGWGLGVGY